MKFCKKCNKNVSDTYSFCPFCGGTLDNIKKDNVVKICKKCNKEFPDNFKYCSFCGGDLEVKDSFWNSQKVLGHFMVGNNKRVRVTQDVKDNKEFITIGRQYFNSSTKDYVYKNSVAIPVNCIKDLISILNKVK